MLLSFSASSQGWLCARPPRRLDEERANVTEDLRAQFEAQQVAEQALAQADALLRDQAAAQELEDLRKERAPLVASRLLFQTS